MRDLYLAFLVSILLALLIISQAFTARAQSGHWYNDDYVYTPFEEATGFGESIYVNWNAHARVLSVTPEVATPTAAVQIYGASRESFVRNSTSLTGIKEIISDATPYAWRDWPYNEYLDEEISLGNFNQVNFIGTGVEATDAGDGRVDVNIPGANESTVLNNITGSENWGFTYLIGNATSSTLTLSNPFTDNRSILVSLRETAPPYRVHTTEINSSSSEKIILSATEIPSLNQFALSVIRAATSFLCGGAEVIEVTHGLGTDKVIAQAWENSGSYRAAWADTVITDTTMKVTFPESVPENAYRISLYPTFNYWSFPDTDHSEVEHSLNDRNLISMIVDEDGGSATLDVLHEHNNSLVGNFEETPTADQYRIFSIPVHAPFSDFNGTVNSASEMTIIDGEVIGAN